MRRKRKNKVILLKRELGEAENQ